MNAATTVEPTPATDTAHAIALVPASGSDGLCLSARDFGIWASSDAGVTWRQVFGAGSPDRRIIVTSLAFAADAATSQTVFAGALGAVVRSVDGGRQWRAVALPNPAPLVTSLAVSPAYDEDGVVLAATLEDGVLRSDDRGEHWKRWNFGLLDLSVYAIAASPNFAGNDTLFAGTETALFTSENGGRSWRETTFPETHAPVLALAFDGHGTLWAGTDGHGIWRSPDKGATWDRVDTGTITEPVNGFVLTDNAILAVLPEAIMTSPDQGNQWHTAVSGMSDGGGIAAVAPLPERVAQRVSSDVVGPVSVPEGLRDAQRGFQSSAATAAIADSSGAPSMMILIQLRDGSVRQLRIETNKNTGKGTR